MSTPPTTPSRANRLAEQSSPYLRQHAFNPVDWYPWGEEALAKARAEDRPILLSVGYSACHWCHVMAHESFEDPAIAEKMNAWFASVKVDREERPDLDQLYQGVVALMGQGGGWPLTVFLTPDLRPFFGGTYFPPEDRYGRPGFPRLLEGLHEAWTTRRAEVEDQANRFRDGLAHTARYGLEAAAESLEPGDVLLAGRKLSGELDPVFGGFGGAPKFPNPMALELMLRAFRRAPEGADRDALKDGVLHGLERMALGGLFDQLGGGFHRYTVDRAWRVPHFEKMLYDNAQLLHLVAEAQQLAPRPSWRRVAEETCAWLEREMTAPSGGFYAAQDADSEGEEGKFFVWSPEELDAVLAPREAEVCKLRFEVTAEGNFEGGRTVLAARMPISEIASRLSLSDAEVESALASARARLFEIREGRVRPGRDDKILAGWNGLAIRGLAFAGRVFGEPEWVARAKRSADFILGALWDGKRLRRVFHGTAKIDGFVEDYGDLCSGLVALYQATFEPRWLEAAEALANRAVALFWDEEAQAYLSAPKGQTDLLCPTYALHDGAAPSGASTLTEAQVALAALTGRTAHLEQAERYLRKLRRAMVNNPFAYGHLLLAADALLDGAASLTLVASDAELNAWTKPLARTYAPAVAVCRVDPDGPIPEVLVEEVSGRGRVKGRSAAYLCRNFVCGMPFTEPEALGAALSSSPGSP